MRLRRNTRLSGVIHTANDDRALVTARVARLIETTMLTGSELLAKVKELGEASKSDLVRAAGYVSTKKDGTERLNFTAFYEALLEAKGVSLGDGVGKGKGNSTFWTCDLTEDYVHINAAYRT